MSGDTGSEGGVGRFVALGLVGIVMVLILPIPPLLLDVLLAISVTSSLLIFLLAIHYDDPVQFSTFPSVLLVATMLRLALNIASTRLILLHGHEGPDAAGEVIQAFGAFVVGGSYLVGVIVFLILVVINFQVITSGAGRISEVAARFTLDAMPGKQMAIDNDLANGHITEEQAKARRKAVADEADFYGAMDGANKFVKGDAVAGLVITAINILAGMVIGVFQQGLEITDAAATYTILTVGDGLVSQVPSLLVATAAGIIATRTASGTDLGTALFEQLVSRAEPLRLSAFALGGLAIVPGMPTAAFGLLAVASYALARRAKALADAVAAGATAAQPPTKRPGGEEPPLHELLKVDLLALEVGFDLVPLVDRRRGGELIQRVTGIRKQLVQELGFVLPPVHVRDNLQLKAGEYRLLLSGTSLGGASLRVTKLMAIDPGNVLARIPGEPTTEPAYGMPAVWVNSGDKDRAQVLGYTVVDPPTVAATHITELLRKAAPDLLGRAEAQELLDAFARHNPKLVEELIPTIVPLGDVIKVLRNLLSEGVSIRDLRTILEALADHGSTVKDPGQLTELVRVRLGRALTARFIDERGDLHALMLDAAAEQALRHANVDATALPRLVRGLEAAVQHLAASPTEPLLLTAADLRPTVAALAARHAPGLAVMSLREVDTRTNVRTVGVVKLAA
jgi:flagellar biosynthesis protein FlhA